MLKWKEGWIWLPIFTLKICQKNWVMHIFRNWKKYANEIFSNQDSLLLSIIPIILGLTFSTSCRKLGMFYSYIPCPLLWYIIWSGEKHHCNMRKIQQSTFIWFSMPFCRLFLYQWFVFSSRNWAKYFIFMLFYIEILRKSNIYLAKQSMQYVRHRTSTRIDNWFYTTTLRLLDCALKSKLH